MDSGGYLWCYRRADERTGRRRGGMMRASVCLGLPRALKLGIDVGKQVAVRCTEARAASRVVDQVVVTVGDGAGEVGVGGP